ncbi:MAG: DUF6531 domain-containing protein, partial [Gordonia amarae]
MTGDAHQVVGERVVRFGEGFEGLRGDMRGVRQQAPGAHREVNSSADLVDRLEGELATARTVAANAAAAESQAMMTAGMSGGNPVALAALATAEGERQAADRNVDRLVAELEAARARHRRAWASWKNLVGRAEKIHAELESDAVAVQKVIDEQKAQAFEKNPSGWRKVTSAVSNWLDDHADVLKRISDALIFLGSIAAMFPGMGSLVGGLMLGAGALMQLALTMNGNMTMTELTMSVVSGIPGVGKGAALVKGVGKAGGKELLETAGTKQARKVEDCVRPGEPVDGATGALSDSWSELSVAGVLPIEFTRHYCSSAIGGRWFGGPWSCVLDMRVEVFADQIIVVCEDGSVVKYAHPQPGEEVLPEFGCMPLEFVDGAYLVRDVPAGVTYEFSMVSDTSSVTMAAGDCTAESADRNRTGDASSSSTVGGSSLAGLTDVSVGIGLTAIIHHSGHRIGIDYDQASGLPTRMRRDSATAVLVHTDPETERITGLSMTDDAGVGPVPVVTYGYDSHGNLTEVTNAAGGVLGYRYADGDRGRLLGGWTDEAGHSYRYRWDQHERVVAEVGTAGMFANAFVYLPDRGGDAGVGGSVMVMIETVLPELPVTEGDAGIETRLERLTELPVVVALNSGGLGAGGLDGGGRGGEIADRVADAVVWDEVAAALDPRLAADDAVLGAVHPWVYRSDVRGDVWRVVSPLGAVTDYTRDRAHQLTSWTRPDGGCIRFEPDRYGCVTGTEFPDGRRESIEFGGFGIPARITDPAGRVTELVCDEVGNVISVSDPAGLVTRMDYHVGAGGSWPRRRVDPDGAVTEYECDSAGRVVRVITPLGGVWSFGRDVFGRIVSELDPDGNETIMRWSVDGHLLEQRFADGTAITHTYDRAGNRIGTVDEAGNTTSTAYTVFGTPSVFTDAAGGRLQITYDSVLKVSSVTSPDGLVWSYRRDRDGRVVSDTDYNEATTTYRYDGCGRMIGRTDALGRTTTIDYDRCGRITGELSSTDGRTSYRYNPAGDLVEAANADAVVRWEFDAAGRPVCETINGIAVRSAYDQAGRRHARRLSGLSSSAAGPEPDSSGSWQTLIDYQRGGLVGSVVTDHPQAPGAPTV